jgi:hypothetical protein
MAMKKHESRSPAASPDGNALGRFVAKRDAWQTIADLTDKPCIYRIINPAGSGNSLIVFRGDPPQFTIAAGNSLDILAKTILVRAGTDGRAENVEGRYVLLA